MDTRFFVFSLFGILLLNSIQAQQKVSQPPPGSSEPRKVNRIDHRGFHSGFNFHPMYFFSDANNQLGLKSGIGFGYELGGGITESTVILLKVDFTILGSSQDSDPYTFANIGGELRQYLKNNFYIGGGAGYGMFEHTDGDLSGTGAGVFFNIGKDMKIGKRGCMGFQWYFSYHGLNIEGEVVDDGDVTFQEMSAIFFGPKLCLTLIPKQPGAVL